MRVTNKMISDTVITNLRKGIERYMELQTQMSTGRRINNPSDDPSGTIQSLSFRSTLRKIEQYGENISYASSWLSQVDTVLDEVNTALSNANALAVQLGSDNQSDESMTSGAEEVKSMLDQLVRSVNTQFKGQYVFSGFRTTTTSVTAYGTGVVYNGDDGNIQLEVEEGARMSINITASDILTESYMTLGEDADINPGISATTLISDLNAGTGVDQVPGTFDIVDKNLGITATIDLSGLAPTATVQDAIDEINNQLAANVPPITNLTAEIGPEGNNIRLVATDRNEINGATPLTNVKQGGGVDMEPGKLLIHNDDSSISFDVDLTSASTIQDVVDTMNATFAANPDPQVNNLVASINPAGTGLRIEDTNGTPLGLYVSEFNDDGTTASDLGIYGFIGADMIGDDLEPIPEFDVNESGAGETTAENLGILGTMNYYLVGSDLNPTLTADTVLSQLDNGNGIAFDEIQILHGDLSQIIDLGASGITTIQDVLDAINSSGLDVTASINPSGIGIQIVNDDQTRSLIVKDVSTSGTARALGIEGSPDIAGTMIALQDFMEDGDREGIRLSVEPLTEGLNDILTLRASTGAKLVRLEATETKMADIKLNYTELLSNTEDADLTQLVTDLAQQETIYTAALQAAAKIMQPTLLDFLG